MNIPFSTEQFLAVFVRYNEAVWPLQWLLNGLALLSLVALAWRGAWGGRLVAGILALLWTWMAVAYHFAFFSRINPAAWGFGILYLAGALGFAWLGVVRERLRFAPRGGLRGWSGAVLVGYGLVLYPLIGYASGQHYPAVPTFGLPCPTTIFTIGILMFATAPLPRWAVAVPLGWSAIGSVAAFQLGIVQDYGLLVAGLVGLAATVFPPSPAPRSDAAPASASA